MQTVYKLLKGDDNVEDLDFIKNFSKINIKKICKDKKVNRSNVLNGIASKNVIKLVRKGIESEYAKLYLEDKDDKKDNSL